MALHRNNQHCYFWTVYLSFSSHHESSWQNPKSLYKMSTPVTQIIKTGKTRNCYKTLARYWRFIETFPYQIMKIHVTISTSLACLALESPSHSSFYSGHPSHIEIQFRPSLPNHNWITIRDAKSKPTPSFDVLQTCSWSLDSTEMRHTIGMALATG